MMRNEALRQILLASLALAQLGWVTGVDAHVTGSAVHHGSRTLGRSETAALHAKASQSSQVRAQRPDFESAIPSASTAAAASNGSLSTQGPTIPSVPPPPSDVSAAKQALRDALPVTQAEVRRLKARLDALERASAAPVGFTPKPVSSSISITQSPGETPPLVRLAVGNVSSVVFTDITGAPWPVVYAVPGDRAKFQVTIPTANSPAIEINQLAAYPSGDVNVTLKGDPIPVTLTLISGQREVDTRLDVRILKRGPNAAAQIIKQPIPETADKTITDFLDGVAPHGAQDMKTSLAGVQAWRLKGNVYLRTKLALLSPAWTNSVASADGTNAYEIADTPVVLVSDNGTPVSVSVQQ